MKHFLGLPSLCFFTTFLQFLSTFYGKVAFWKGAGRSGSKIWQEKEQQKPGKKRKLSMLEEFVMIMMKLRLGLDNLTLSVLFGVSVGHVSILFNTWINFLAQILESVIKWPSSAKIRKHLPLSFKLKYPKTTSIIDCTEIFIQKPKNCSARSSTWSNYKSHNTLKALVAIQPNGAFTFVSKLWSGNISDRKITIDSKYLDNISPGDEVMADRGFQIRDLLHEKLIFCHASCCSCFLQFYATTCKEIQMKCICWLSWSSSDILVCVHNISAIKITHWIYFSINFNIVYNTCIDYKYLLNISG